MFGIHVHKNDHDSIETAIEYSIAAGWRCGQIYTHGPKSYSINKINITRLAELGESFPLYVHGTYFQPWNGEAKNIAHVKANMTTCQAIGAHGLVVHLPKRPVESIVAIMPAITTNASAKCPIILEMPSMHADPTKTYETPQKINTLIKEIEALSTARELRTPSDKIHFGICIDTSHVWAAGVSMRYYEETCNFFSAIDKPDKIKLIHLNGTKIDFNGGKDTHIIFGTAEDKIWHGISWEHSGVRAVVEFCKRYNCPIILEINRGEDHLIVEANRILAAGFA